MARASARSDPAKAYLHEQAASTGTHSNPVALQTMAVALVVAGLACLQKLSMQQGKKEVGTARRIPILVILPMCAE